MNAKIFQQFCLFLSEKATEHSYRSDLQVLISAILPDCRVSYIFPLYLYPETEEQGALYENDARTPNLDPGIVKQISEKLGMAFTNEKETTPGTFAPFE